MKYFKRKGDSPTLSNGSGQEGGASGSVGGGGSGGGINTIVRDDRRDLFYRMEEPAPLKAMKSVKKCFECDTLFSFFSKKFHCANCGEIYCSKCSMHKSKIPHYGYTKKKRVCNLCFLLLSIRYKKWERLTLLSKEMLEEYLDMKNVEYDEAELTRVELLKTVQQVAMEHNEQNSTNPYVDIPNDARRNPEGEEPFESRMRSMSSPYPNSAYPPPGMSASVTRNRSASASPNPYYAFPHPGHISLNSSIGEENSLISSHNLSFFESSLYPPVRELTEEETEYVSSLPVRQLKNILMSQHIDASDCIEKMDLENKVKTCMASSRWKGKPLYRPSNSASTPASSPAPVRHKKKKNSRHRNADKLHRHSEGGSICEKGRSSHHNSRKEKEREKRSSRKDRKRHEKNGRKSRSSITRRKNGRQEVDQVQQLEDTTTDQSKTLVPPLSVPEGGIVVATAEKEDTVVSPATSDTTTEGSEYDGHSDTTEILIEDELLSPERNGDGESEAGGRRQDVYEERADDVEEDRGEEEYDDDTTNTSINTSRSTMTCTTDTTYDGSKTEREACDELFEENVCKICYERDINCVLLECGHLCSCIECGRRLRDCPICRRFITRIVETYRV